MRFMAEVLGLVFALDTTAPDRKDATHEDIVRKHVELVEADGRGGDHPGVSRSSFERA